MELIELIAEMARNDVEVRFSTTTTNDVQVALSDWKYAMRDFGPQMAVRVFPKEEFNRFEDKEVVMVKAIKKLYNGLLRKRDEK